MSATIESVGVQLRFREPHSEQVASQEILPRAQNITSPTVRIINTFPRLHGKTLAQTPDSEIAKWCEGTDAVWLMGTMKRSPQSVRIGHALRNRFTGAIPDLSDEHIIGSPFASASWDPDPRIARNIEELGQQAERIRQRFGKKVLVDFIPNHVGLDHELVTEENIRAGMFLYRTDRPSNDEMQYYFEFHASNGEVLYLCHGRNSRNPNDEPWTDTVQFNLANEKTRNVLRDRLVLLAKYFDGVRVDMAMLPTPRIIKSTWWDHLSEKDRVWVDQQIAMEEKGDVSHQFFAEALRDARREARKYGRDFIAIAEAYEGYGQNGNLLSQGFDMIYEQGLYDHILDVIRSDSQTFFLTDWLRKHLTALKNGAVHVGNHDEIPAIRKFGARQEWVEENGQWKQEYIFRDSDPAQITRGVESARAAAVLIGLLQSGAFLVDDLQREGYYGEKQPVQVGVLPKGKYVEGMQDFYDLLYYLKTSNLFQHGEETIPRLRIPITTVANQPDWSDWQDSHESIIPLQFATETEQAVVCVNVKDAGGKCLIPIPEHAEAVGVLDIIGGRWLTQQEISPLGDPNGYYIELPAHGAQMVYFKKGKH